MTQAMAQAMARATTRAATYNNSNQPGTHLPPKIAPDRPSFLIHCPELDTDLTCTKQTRDPVSNRQFFAFLKFPASGKTQKPQNFQRRNSALPKTVTAAKGCAGKRGRARRRDTGRSGDA